MFIFVPAFDELFDAEHKLLLHVQFGEAEYVFHVLPLHGLEHLASNLFSPGDFDERPEAYFPQPLAQSFVAPLLDVFNVPFEREEKVISTGYFYYLLARQGLERSGSDLSLHFVQELELGNKALMALAHQIGLPVPHCDAHQLANRDFHH